MGLIKALCSGARLAFFTGKTLFSKAAHNDVVRVLNAFLNFQVVRTGQGGKNECSISEQNVTLSISNDASGAGSMNYKGEYDVGYSYAVNDVARVSPSNDVSTVSAGVTGSLPGVYICIRPTPGSGNVPRNPAQSGGENAFWQWLATWPSAVTNCNNGVEENWVADAQKIPDA